MGAALGQAGLKKHTRHGMATLMIAANLPDVDALSVIAGRALAWRRGWTHGPLALVVLPLLLVLAMVMLDRWQMRRGTASEARSPVRIRWLLALAYVGILSHPLLDILNTYGIRCLMPFSDRWYYGDALFIVDIWMWSAFALGVWWSRRREAAGAAGSGRPAVIALFVAATYAAAMGMASVAAERFVARDVVARGLGAPVQVVASPVPIDPFRRRVVFSTGQAYGQGDLRWTPTPRLTLEPALVPTHMDDPAIARAAQHSQRVADFLYWSRLPFAEIQRDAGRTHVTLGDARYNRRPGDGPFTVRATIPK